MKQLVLCTCAILALLALPAAADDTANMTPAVQTGAAPEPLFLQGPPEDAGGPCRIPPPFQPEACICPLIFAPVCGCDNRTYGNACFASCFVRSFTEGACEGDEV